MKYLVLGASGVLEICRYIYPSFRIFLPRLSWSHGDGGHTYPVGRLCICSIIWHWTRKTGACLGPHFCALLVLMSSFMDFLG